jgi:hypothetical protein
MMPAAIGEQTQHHDALLVGESVGGFGKPALRRAPFDGGGQVGFEIFQRFKLLGVFHGAAGVVAMRRCDQSFNADAEMPRRLDASSIGSAGWIVDKSLIALLSSSFAVWRMISNAESGSKTASMVSVIVFME